MKQLDRPRKSPWGQFGVELLLHGEKSAYGGGKAADRGSEMTAIPG